MQPRDRFFAHRRYYNYETTITTNISANYLDDSGSRWGIWEMLRESIQNMSDEAEFQADNHGGKILDYCLISYYPKEYLELHDKGRGVDFEQILLIGESGKRGSHYKGQKGEGESLSFLVAARKGIQKMMFSKDWACEARLDNYANGCYKVLVFDVYKTNKPIDGTYWRYSDTEPNDSYYCDTDTIGFYYKNLGNYFPELSKRTMRQQETAAKQEAARRWKAYQKFNKPIAQPTTSSKRSIFSPTRGTSSKLYVRGVYVKSLNALFSYNLDVDINRDRSMVDEFQILPKIGEVFNSSDITESQMIRYWKSATDDTGNPGLLEYRTIINFDSNREDMRTAFFKAFGKKACLFTNKVAALDAEALGFKVIDLFPYVKDTAINLGLVKDTQVLGYNGDILPIKSITSKQQALVDKLTEIGKALKFRDYKIELVEKVLNVDTARLAGMYKDGIIYLMKSSLNGDRLELLKTYIHEAGHGESGSSDATRTFTEFFETLAVKAIMGEFNNATKLVKELLEI